LPSLERVVRLGTLFRRTSYKTAGGKCVALRRHSKKFMAVRIRMKRVGAKNAPYFRIVVSDSRSPRDGKFIEEIGTYQPLKKGVNFQVNLDRANYWVSKGALPSETVGSILKMAAKTAEKS